MSEKTGKFFYIVLKRLKLLQNLTTQVIFAPFFLFLLYIFWELFMHRYNLNDFLPDHASA